MTTDLTQNEGGLSRRTIVKGAAWSVPVMAAAIAAPAAVATGGPNWDVQVTANCQNEYDITTLTTLLESLSANPLYQVLVPGLVVTVQTALAAIGIDDDAARNFTITALEGTVPAGTQFQMTYPALLNINTGILEGLIEAQALTVVNIDSTGAIFTLDAPLTVGNSITIDIIDSIVNVGALSAVTLSLVGSDNPTSPGSEGADSATISTLLAPAVDLGSLGIPNVDLGLIEIVIDGDLAVQLCA